MSTQELLIVVNENNEEVGVQERGAVLGSQQWRRASGVILYDPERQLVLCHQRSTHKDERAGLWTCTFGGKVLAGEEALEAAQRELREELGIQRSVSDFLFTTCYKAVSRKQFEYISIVWADALQECVYPDPEEVACVEWIAATDCVRKLRKDGQWHLYGYEMGLLEWLL